MPNETADCLISKYNQGEEYSFGSSRQIFCIFIAVVDIPIRAQSSNPNRKADPVRNNPNIIGTEASLNHPVAGRRSAGSAVIYPPKETEQVLPCLSSHYALLSKKGMWHVEDLSDNAIWVAVLLK
jgi:hypothetical protein